MSTSQKQSNERPKPTMENVWAQYEEVQSLTQVELAGLQEKLLENQPYDYAVLSLLELLGKRNLSDTAASDTKVLAELEHLIKT